MSIFDKFVAEFTAKDAQLHLRIGTVSSVDSANNTITVLLPGAATSISGIVYLKSYTPTANDVVILLQDGTELLALGTVA